MSGDICAGWNSEALIPLLLCFTTKLESLDYGGTVLPIMYPSPTAREGIRIHEYCSGQGYRWQPKSNHDDGFDWFDECWGTRDKGASWFYSVLNRKTPLPGLSHLRKFTHGGCINDNHWPGEYLSQIMLLPRLEEWSSFPNLQELVISVPIHPSLSSLLARHLQLENSSSSTVVSLKGKLNLLPSLQAA
ncbi:hypothetical protein TWF569_004812 [Orbilia oligospora]|uniref:Uncharacterized protein n=1 Tax=Orbilia oligospora TaxID=2813651 RepID=A0A7C8NRY4_ORBOL|nr:hypothetical protein TWF706_008090 [Orbilia oligospora]KAF3101217.1 hypothetical protein TWF102_005015 [Orbilia oligospora]KAF3113658.1 hypothetical protein TWF103_002010 [Orbilia oligospora]KAF3149892.1 hypothetical protein TWF569_004812 [Orbilia oligospora]